MGYNRLYEWWPFANAFPLNMGTGKDLVFVFAFLTWPHSALHTVGVIKYLLKNGLNNNKTAGKYCLTILFQSVGNNPIDNPIKCVGNKAAQFSKTSGVERTTNLRLSYYQAKNFLPFSFMRALGLIPRLACLISRNHHRKSSAAS